MKNFIMNDKECADAAEWMEKHKKRCKIARKTQRWSFIFTPTGIGDGVDVKCACGKTHDVTDVSDW